MERILLEKNAVLRHGKIELLEHWLLALSGFVLIFSGFGELPMYKRFMLTQVPGLAWAGDFFIQLKIHYLSAIVFLTVMVFHAVYHGWLRHQGLLPRRGDLKASLQVLASMAGLGQEPKSDKYLPEQRLAYAYLGGVGLILTLTGAVKVIKNLPGVYLSPSVVTSMTLIHTFGTMFFLAGVLAHMAALILKVNRPLAKSIFTGKVDLDYVRERHSLWYKRMVRKTKPVEIQEEESRTSTEPGKSEVPEVRENTREITNDPKEETMKDAIRIKGMSCHHCVMSIEKALSQLEGLQNIEVDLEKQEARFTNTKPLPADFIEKAIEDAGYEIARA